MEEFVREETQKWRAESGSEDKAWVVQSWTVPAAQTEAQIYKVLSGQSDNKARFALTFGHATTAAALSP